MPPDAREYRRRSWRLWRAYVRGDLGPLAYAWLYVSLRDQALTWRDN